LRGDRRAHHCSRPIEGDWSYLWIDATHLKGRQNGRLVSVATIIAVGVNNDGRREILGPDISPSEAQTLWTEFSRKLRDAGTRHQAGGLGCHEGIEAGNRRC